MLIFLVVLAACAIALFCLSSDLKRKAGIWLIAKASAEQEARVHFRIRHAELTKYL
jgi:hypothetical protein